MCLDLNKNSEKATKRLKSSKKPIKVYKVVFEENGRIFSPIYTFNWKLGETNISTRKYNEIHVYEERYLEVNTGFHFYTNKRDAMREINTYYIKELKRNCNGLSLMECEVNPENIVVVGNYNNKKSLVSTQAKAIRIIRK